MISSFRSDGTSCLSFTQLLCDMSLRTRAKSKYTLSSFKIASATLAIALKARLDVNTARPALSYGAWDSNAVSMHARIHAFPTSLAGDYGLALFLNINVVVVAVHDDEHSYRRS